MHFDVLSLQPGLVAGFISESIVKRAITNHLLEVVLIDLRDYGLGRSRKVDDYQYGGGGGMVITAPALSRAIEYLLTKRTYDEIIYLTPDGSLFDQMEANALSLKNNVLLICGHYKGIDERIREIYVTKEVSVGDYVLSGGEIPAAVVIDAVSRLLPGALRNASSALTDTFQDGLLSAPVYTRPENFKGKLVPSVLTSGNPATIGLWRHEMSLLKTIERRPDLLKRLD